MIKILHYATALLLVAIALPTFAQDNADTSGTTTFESDDDRVSYALGMITGKNFKGIPLKFNIDVFIKALQKELASEEHLLSDAELQATMATFQQKVRTAQAAEGEKNIAAGKAYLAENATKDGVIVTKSGLQYKVITEGTGAKPTRTDSVSAHYRGTLIDGTEFDSSYKRGEPSSFGVTRVIKGWTEALLLMNVGSKWQLTIPGELAYGPNPRSPDIPPNAVLLFDIELVAIEK